MILILPYRCSPKRAGRFLRGNSADAAVGDAQNPYRHGEEYIEPGGDAEKAAGGPGPAQSQLGPDVLHTQHKVDAHRHQQRTEGGDVDGDEIHPRPPIPGKN